MNVRHKHIDRVIITGKYEGDDLEKAGVYLNKHDYKIVRSGPTRTAKYAFIPTRFKLVGEKEIK